MKRQEQQQITEEQGKVIATILKPLLKDGTIEIRQSKDGILIYQVRRKEIKRLPY